MSHYYPEGQLLSGDKIILTYWDNTNLYSFTKNNKYEIVASTEGVISTVLDNTVIFELSGSQTKLKFLTSKTEGLSDANGLAILSAPKEYKVTSVATEDWGSPTVLLSGAKYTLDGVKFTLGTDTSADHFIPLSLTYFHSCNGSTCKESTAPVNSVLTAYCGLKNTKDGSCAAANIPSWTNKDDASVGHEYVYCSKNKVCGDSSNCKGKCKFGQSCIYDSSKYRCKTGTQGAERAGESLLKKTWFIVVLIIVAILIVIIGIGFILYMVRHNQKKAAIQNYGGYNPYYK